MKVVMFSSIFNHHSLPFCDQMYQHCHGDFCFVETMQEETERQALGYHKYDRPYVISMTKDEENFQLARKWALEADVMIAGVFPYELLRERAERHKLTFLCQERMFKGENSVIRRLKAWYHTSRRYGRYTKDSLYLLAIGKNAAKDYHSIGFFRDRAFLWAYFTALNMSDQQRLGNSSIKVLFAGRLIPLKNPDYPLRAIIQLRQEGHPVSLEYVGIGECEDSLKQMVNKHHVEGLVTFWGSMSPERVREHMLRADIFAFTSNSMEGWGAVVNEAMASGCAVVASESAGSVTTLIHDGINGLIYSRDSYHQFYEKMKMAVVSTELRHRLGEAAVRTMQNQYNASVAAERFCTVAKAILDGQNSDIYKDGVMSKL